MKANRETFFSFNPGAWQGIKVFSTNLRFPSSNSRHQDYYVFSKGSQPKPSFATPTQKTRESNISPTKHNQWYQWYQHRPQTMQVNQLIKSKNTHDSLVFWLILKTFGGKASSNQVLVPSFLPKHCGINSMNAILSPHPDKKQINVDAPQFTSENSYQSFASLLLKCDCKRDSFLFFPSPYKVLTSFAKTTKNNQPSNNLKRWKENCKQESSFQNMQQWVQNNVVDFASEPNCWMHRQTLFHVKLLLCLPSPLHHVL